MIIINDALQNLAERGFIRQCSDPEELAKRMNAGPITLYVGIDPTSPSLHVGHLVPVLAAAHLALAGHRVILLIGGGTARIGDPSGRSEIRKIISIETIKQNALRIQKQLSFIFEQLNAEALFMDNTDWLAELNYIDFLRDIGRHFSVNRMLSFEAYRTRMEGGLSFIEFNYQLLQSYDFLELYRRQACELQIGGDDQWGNIVAGIDLIRRVEGHEVSSFGLTFPLITRSDGKKMGKTEKGAVFLDAELCSPFDFFQYWRNVVDEDVIPFLKIFTFLSKEEIEVMAAWKDEKINEAKERLAYEFTTLIHGRETANKVRESLRAAFRQEGQMSDAIPQIALSTAELGAGIGILALFYRSGLCASKAAARRLVEQGGARLNDVRLESIDRVVTAGDFGTGGIILRAGKKHYARVVLKT